MGWHGPEGVSCYTAGTARKTAHRAVPGPNARHEARIGTAMRLVGPCRPDHFQAVPARWTSIAGCSRTKWVHLWQKLLLLQHVPTNRLHTICSSHFDMRVVYNPPGFATVSLQAQDTPKHDQTHDNAKVYKYIRYQNKIID